MLILEAESWTWYSIVILVVAFRFTSRYLHLGSLRRYQPEDYLMLFIICIYTVEVVFMNIVAHVDTNLMLPEEIPSLTPESIKSRVYGSKLVLLVEQCMITTQWGCKVCLLFIYFRLTGGLKQRWAARLVAGYVAFCWLVMEILYFGVWCRPFDQYWAVPVANEQCSAAINHLIVNAVFNISSDLMMLCIPLPLLICAQLPAIKKAILCCLFSLGIFVILCAALNKYYSFTQPFSPIWTYWYIREASTAILVANIPNCWPLLRRIFNLRSFSGSSDRSGPGAPAGAGARSNRARRKICTSSRKQPSDSVNVKTSSTDSDPGAFDHSHEKPINSPKSSSVENLHRGLDDSAAGMGLCCSAANLARETPLEIWQDVEVSVQKSDVSDEEGPGGRRPESGRESDEEEALSRAGMGVENAGNRERRARLGFVMQTQITVTAVRDAG